MDQAPEDVGAVSWPTWEESVSVQSQEGLRLPDGTILVGTFVTFAETPEAARDCAMVYFRLMLESMGIDWRSAKPPPPPIITEDLPEE